MYFTKRAKTNHTVNILFIFNRLGFSICTDFASFVSKMNSSIGKPRFSVNQLKRIYFQDVSMRAFNYVNESMVFFPPSSSLSFFLLFFIRLFASVANNSLHDDTFSDLDCCVLNWLKNIGTMDIDFNDFRRCNYKTYRLCIKVFRIH